MDHGVHVQLIIFISGTCNISFCSAATFDSIVGFISKWSRNLQFYDRHYMQISDRVLTESYKFLTDRITGAQDFNFEAMFYPKWVF